VLAFQMPVIGNKTLTRNFLLFVPQL